MYCKQFCLHVVLACSLPHLGTDKVSDKTVQVPSSYDGAIPVLTREVIWLRFVAHTKQVWEVDPFCSCIKLRCNVWHIVLCTVICTKCAAVWEGCVWSCASSCWENVSDAYHPQVTARGKARIKYGTMISEVPECASFQYIEQNISDNYYHVHIAT